MLIQHTFNHGTFLASRETKTTSYAKQSATLCLNQSSCIFTIKPNHKSHRVHLMTRNTRQSSDDAQNNFTKNYNHSNGIRQSQQLPVRSSFQFKGKELSTIVPLATSATRCWENWTGFSSTLVAHPLPSLLFPNRPSEHMQGHHHLPKAASSKAYSPFHFLHSKYGTRRINRKTNMKNHSKYNACSPQKE